MISLLLRVGASRPGDWTATRRELAALPSFLQDFSCFRARSVVREVMGWHRLGLTLDGFGVSG